MITEEHSKRAMDVGSAADGKTLLLEGHEKGSKVAHSDSVGASSDIESVSFASPVQKRHLVYKSFVLMSIMCLTFGSYWVFDTPGAIPSTLQEYFAERNKTLSDSQNLNFYSIYSWPNTLLALFGGMIVDQVTGLRAGSIMFTALILAGEVMFALGIIFRQYYVALAGRFLFGLGGESLTVTQNSFTVKWFSGKYLALAFGTVVSFARVGSSVNFVVTPIIAETSLPLALYVGIAACTFSFAVCIILSCLDLYAERKLPYLTKKAEEVKTDAPSSSNILKDVKEIPLPAWILNLICMFFYVGVLTFNTVASQIMQHTGHHFTEKQATLFLAIPNFVSIFASPGFGLLVDRVGRAMWWIVLASIMMILSQLAMLGNATGLVSIHPIPIMLWQGVGYAMGASAIWPSLSHVVPAKVCATAYGMMTSIQNIGMAFFPLLIGQLQSAHSIKHKTLKYTLPIMIFILCEAISLSLALLLLGLDKRLTGGRLNSTHTERKALEESEAQATQQLDVARAHAQVRLDALKRANSEQNQLLVRDVMTNRAAYYGRLGVVRPATHVNPIVFRPSFM